MGNSDRGRTTDKNEWHGEKTRRLTMVEAERNTKGERRSLQKATTVQT